MIEQVFYNGSLFLEHLKDAKIQSLLSDTCVNSYDITVVREIRVLQTNVVPES